MAELVTITTFARRLGVSHTAIRFALDNDRIDGIDKKGKIWIDWKEEMPKFVKTSTDAKVIKKFGKMVFGDDEIPSPPGLSRRSTKRDKEGNPLANGTALSEKGMDELDIVDAQQLSAIMKAKQAQLDYEKSLGKVVDLELAMSLFMDIAERVKAGCRAMPDRLCPMFEGMSAADMHMAMTTEIEHILTQLAEDIESKMLEEAEDDGE